MEPQDPWDVPCNTWDVSGYYHRPVNRQANKQEIPAWDGTWDILDVSNPEYPELCTGNSPDGIGCIGMRYALYWVANQGKSGHTYHIRPRRLYGKYTHRPGYIIKL